MDSSPMSLPTLKIVVVEDDPDIREFLRATLELIRRHHSTTSPDGLKAAQLGNLLRHAYPDVDWVPTVLTLQPPR